VNGSFWGLGLMTEVSVEMTLTSCEDKYFIYIREKKNTLSTGIKYHLQVQIYKQILYVDDY